MHPENLPKFHYEVHHVAHKFGHRTPADVKLREVARHAATVTSDDDGDEEEEEEDSAAAAAAEHLTSDDIVYHSALAGSRRSQLADDLNQRENGANSRMAADKKFDDEQMNYDSDSQQKQSDLRDSTKNDYYQEYSEAETGIKRENAKTLARVAGRSSSNNSPSPISDVYFVGMFRLSVCKAYVMHIYDVFLSYFATYQTLYQQWWIQKRIIKCHSRPSRETRLQQNLKAATIARISLGAYNAPRNPYLVENPPQKSSMLLMFHPGYNVLQGHKFYLSILLLH